MHWLLNLALRSRIQYYMNDLNFKILASTVNLLILTCLLGKNYYAQYTILYHHPNILRKCKQVYFFPLRSLKSDYLLRTHSFIEPHIGHAYTLCIADAWSRYTAIRYHPSLQAFPPKRVPLRPPFNAKAFLSSGVDEHGTKVCNGLL